MTQPLYSLADVQALVAADAWGPGTPKCRSNILSLGLARIQVAQVLQNLTTADFRKPFGLCSTDFGDLCADDYVFWIDDITLQRCSPGAGLKLYIKFAIDSDKDGDATVLISFHESLR
ncbi:MAG: type II toxin-antitoxin system MqsR family toxin [Hydrogenophaga sp.]|uniref:type II toxin-antitoxin system MqsR family toxin n=1 Tax=Hydrogenophaga sp. TaxID=1904254 RepID=UPI0027301701|nr:type II toxin-antitoxin system MqsR family toxin [Hydrogenophaga sp.]MDP2015504.1 type II toxin-antitoxin system MqsR family toxin [Hydrogenophaga sp.]MDP3252991.1 type II toxin-antitoxin system MqsR family toxin [Hydrogenophaga sp.]